jgi:hypothetical protein
LAVVAVGVGARREVAVGAVTLVVVGHGWAWSAVAGCSRLWG